MTSTVTMTSSEPATRTQPLVEISGLAKSYGRIHALSEVNLSLYPGEIVGLVGENGAGKSTFVKCLYGQVKPDAGSITVAGRLRARSGVAEAKRSGVAVVQQELSLAPGLTVADNLRLASPHEPWVRAVKRDVEWARKALEVVGLDLDPMRLVADLTLPERQLVEIARVVATDARIIVLDEPSACLSDEDIVRVHEVLRGLRDSGRLILYVTHRLQEIFDLTDRVVVFRESRNLPPEPTTNYDVDSLVSGMLGRPLEEMYPPKDATPEDLVIALVGVAEGDLTDPVSLEVRAGEIVGLAGQTGSGASTACAVLGGALRPGQGQVQIDSQPVSFRNVRAAIAAGVTYCSPERKHDGVFYMRSVVENITAPSLAEVSPWGLIRRSQERRLAARVASRFRIDKARLTSRIRTLSGGNQQKVALGKWVAREPRVIAIDEPTRGVDVGARAEIYADLRAMTKAGMAVVVASSDTQEIVGLCDRVHTFFRGSTVAEYEGSEISLERITRDISHGN